MKKMMPPMSGPKAVQKHENALHKGQPKTFKKGGPTSKDCMTMGRNMARAANQKTG
jgi:hypothetical protein